MEIRININDADLQNLLLHKMPELPSLKPEHLVSEAMKKPPEPADHPAPPAEAPTPKPKRAPKMPEPLNKSVDVVSDPAAITEPPPEIVVAKVPDFEPSPGVTIITDAELMDAVSKAQERVKNAVAIRLLINNCGVKSPPDRLILMPQDQRQKFLDGLKEIKPLA